MKILGRGEKNILILSASVSEMMALIGTRYPNDIYRLQPGDQIDIKKAIETARILQLNGGEVQRCADKLQEFVDKLRKNEKKRG